MTQENPAGTAPRPLTWKLVVDAADPHAQTVFWAAALGYAIEDNSDLVERLLGLGAVREDETLRFRGRLAFRDLAAVRHPEDPYDEGTGSGLGRRILFQRVPEPKAGKNRLHIDVHAGRDVRDAELARLEALGATVVRQVKEQGGDWVVMTDPEGNEFCLN